MGIFHRDIKPENILFSQGHPIVADFGIAKAIVTAGGMNLTRTGYPLGTPGYMSPEQAAGLTDLDERTDVYSLAVVIYETLVGEIPGRWPTEDAWRAGRFLEAPASHRARLAQVGGVIEGALVRGMAIRHDQRTATPGTLLEELTGVAAARRRYSEEEVRDIVQRAAEAEASAPTASGAMTVGGIEALAAEVGISPDAVREAARAVAATPHTPVRPRPETNRPNIWLGAPTRLMLERVVEGEVPEAEFPVLVEEIRTMLNRPGQISQIGRTFSWTSAGSPGSTRAIEVSVAVRGGRTRLSVRESLGNLIGGVFGGVCGGAGGGGMGPLIAVLVETGRPAALLAALPLWFATTFAVARSSYHYAVRRRRRELEGLLDRLAALAEELVPRRPALDAPAQRLLR
jgi:hypothetical protein